MADTKNYGKYGKFSFSRGKSLFDLSIQSASTEFYGLRIGASGMYGMQGTYMFGPGVGKTVRIGNFNATLFVYPSYSSVHGLDTQTTSGQMNWRTTLDISMRSNSKIKTGIGLMHISNGGYRRPNQGIEALRLSIEYILE